MPYQQHGYMPTRMRVCLYMWCRSLPTILLVSKHRVGLLPCMQPRILVKVTKLAAAWGLKRVMVY